MYNFRLKDEPNYTNRALEILTIKELGEGSVISTGGSGFGLEKEYLDQLTEGKTYLLECRNFNNIAGIVDLETSEYLFRRTDEYFEEQHRKFVEDLAIERRAELEKKRNDWQSRQDALPSPFRERLEMFHERSGDQFRLEGWGYELVICELATMYAGNASEKEIDEYAHREGTSGNQHGTAKFLAQHKDNPDFLRAPAGLAPLRGNF